MATGQQQEQLSTALRHLRDAAVLGAAGANEGEAAANDVLACAEQIISSIGSPGMCFLLSRPDGGQAGTVMATRI